MRRAPNLHSLCVHQVRVNDQTACADRSHTGFSDEIASCSTNTCSLSLADQPEPTQGGGTGRSQASPGALTWGSLLWNGRNQLHFALTVRSASRKAVAETRASESRDTHEQDKTRSTINESEQRSKRSRLSPHVMKRGPLQAKRV